MNRLPDAAELVAHQRWIRALARSLVADASTADDLVQDAWVAALESGPRAHSSSGNPSAGDSSARDASAGSFRGWFATILRRRAAEKHREDRSRERREEIAVRDESLPSTLDMIGRAAVQRDLVQAVLDLEEPYRTTILWRYFEELPPRSSVWSAARRLRPSAVLETPRKGRQRRFGLRRSPTPTDRSRPKRRPIAYRDSGRTYRRADKAEVRFPMSTRRKFKFTTASLDKKAAPPDPASKAKDIIYWDESQESPPGFGIRVGRVSAGGRVVRTFVVQRDMPGGKTKRVSLGRWLDDVSLDRARELALEARKAMKDGRDPQAKPAEGSTLRDAFERHVRSMKTRRKQPRSISDAEYDAQHYWGRYLDRELHTFSRVELDDIHTELTEKRGPAAADRACRLFRAAWRNMMRLHESLPNSPTFGITWNGQTEERKPIAWGVFPTFWATIDSGVKNPVRADLVRVLVLTGLRSLDCRTIEWADISGLDGDAPTLHRPNPKGGPKAAFTIPLSAPVARILRRRFAENAELFPGSPLVFPTVSRDNRVVPVHNAEEDALRPFGYFPHAARHTFASACSEAGLSVLATKALLNHRSKDITEGYQKLSVEYLREATERVAAFLLGKAGIVAEAA